MHRLDTFPTKELIQQYRNVFSSKEGSRVLAHIAYELGVFEDSQNKSVEDIALRNYWTRLCNILGGGEVKFDTMDVFVKRLMSQPLKEEREEKED